MRPRRRLASLLSAVATLLAHVAAGQSIEQLIGNASAFFGTRGDGVRIGEGQGFRLPEPATLQYAAFLFENSGQPDSGVPPGTDTDEIQCVMRTPDIGGSLGAAVVNGFSNTQPGTRAQRWLCFPFSLSLPAGEYVITCENRAVSHYGFIANTDDGSYPLGTRYVGYNSVWTASSWDSTFKIRYFTESELKEEGPVVTAAVIPSLGFTPLTTTFNVHVDASPGITYSFWPDCDATSTDVTSVILQCGPVIQKLGTTGRVITFEHTYRVPGRYTAKIIAQAGCSPPSEVRSAVFVAQGRRRAAGSNR